MEFVKKIIILTMKSLLLKIAKKLTEDQQIVARDSTPMISILFQSVAKKKQEKMRVGNFIM